MQVEQHHQPGARVLVLVSLRDGQHDYMPGVVDHICAANDRDYRVNVRGSGPAASRYWRECAPECVVPQNKPEAA